jgi:hypothetical protein
MIARILLTLRKVYRGMNFNVPGPPIRG